MTTKQLAKRLGLIRRSSKLSLNAKGPSSPKSKQFFDYLIIIDFESTCWKDTKQYGQEIIEFPAVLINTSNGEIESEFHTYVQPQEHPILSDFCTELTGIKQQQVDDGVPLKICLSQFSTWIQKLQKEKHVTFPGVLPTHTSSEQKMCAFVTWSGLDDSRNTARLAWRMICDGCVMKITKSLEKVPPKPPARPGPPVAAQVHKSAQGDVRQASAIVVEDGQDLKDLTSDKTKDMRSGQLCARSNQDSMAGDRRRENGAHRTLINGICTTLGGDNKYRSSTRTSFGPVQNNIKIGAFTSTSLDRSPHDRGHLLMSTTIQTVNDVSALDMDSSSDLSILADWEEAAVIEDSQQDKHEGSVELGEPDLLPVDSASNAVLLLHRDQENMNRCQSVNSNREANLHTKSVVYKSPDTTIYNINMKKPMSNGSAFKLPSALGNRTNIPSLSSGRMNKTSTLLDYFPKKKLTSVSFCSPPKKRPFTIHEDQGNRSLPVTTSGSRLLSHKVVNSTVNLNRTFGAIKSERITAPTCQCGRRAKKLTVSNLGPNHGRVFYSCSVRKRNDENGKGCNYFKWEDTLLKEKSADTSALLSTSIMGTSFNKSVISTGSSAVNKPFIKLRPSMRT